MEPNYTPGVPISDAMRLELGVIIAERFMFPDEQPDPLNPSSGFRQEECTEWLHDLGFERVEWAQPTDHILYLSLWRSTSRGRTMLDEFILEFAGQDSLVISLFNFIKERLI